MKRIYKYPFAVDDNIPIKMPRGAHVLDVQVQREQPCIWAIVDDKAPAEERWFRLYGTGHPVDPVNGAYVGTFQLRGGQLVFHLFEAAQA